MVLFGTSMSVGPNGVDTICLANVNVCAQCFQANAKKRCGNCKCATYCSQPCQASHWKTHKHVCKQLKEYLSKDWYIGPEEEVEMPEDVSEEAQALASSGVDLLTGSVNHMESGYMVEGPQDRDKADELLEQAATLGHSTAQYLTAIRYHVDKDETALKWVHRAANNNHAQAQWALGGQYYLDGLYNHEVSAPKAICWIRRALQHGVSADGEIDITGKTLSKKSFLAGLDTLTRIGRNLYLDRFPDAYDNETTQESWNSDMRLAAACGCIPAINIVCEDNKEN